MQALIRRKNTRRILLYKRIDALVNKNDPKWRNGYLYAVRLLSVTNRSAEELLKRLADKGYEPEITKEIIKELENQGILNDQKLVRETVNWGIHGKRLGRLRIKLELKKRGIRNGVIDEALESYEKATESDLAKTLAKERWEKLDRMEVRLRKKRVYDFLLRRGFEFELSRDVVNQLGKSDEDV